MSPLTVDPPVALAQGRALRPVAGGEVASVLAVDEARGAYDRHAAIYDRLIGTRSYNRIVWGADVADYRSFAAEATDTATGPLLDAGCGTAVFSEAAYQEANRPLALVDRSLGMLARAADRLRA